VIGIVLGFGGDLGDELKLLESVSVPLLGRDLRSHRPARWPR